MGIFSMSKIGNEPVSAAAPAAAASMDIENPEEYYENEKEMSDLTAGFQSLEVGNRLRRIREGRGSFMQDRGQEAVGASGSAAVACPQNMGEQKKIPDDEVVYVIAAHGGWRSSLSGGHSAVISAPREDFENLRFGVLVNENVTLSTLMGEGKQRAVMRHIAGILTGGIKVFQRFAWSEEKEIREGTLAHFPNIILTEGGELQDPFVATIARYYKGTTIFFQLLRSVVSGVLVPFNVQGGFPVAEQRNILNLQRSNLVLLSQVIPLIEQDVISLKQQGADIEISNIVFATCLDGIPPHIRKTWTGKNIKKPAVAGG